jgi:hypothetical protein
MLDPANEEARRLLGQVLGTGARDALALDVTVRPYELVQNPFFQQHRLMMLDPRAYPWLVNGEVEGYYTSANTVGLRCDRLLSKQDALYEVMALRVQRGAESQVVGQLLVRLPDGRTAEAGAPLNVGRIWKVQSLATVHGTNAFGACQCPASVSGPTRAD